jgi:hypothetical protein
VREFVHKSHLWLSFQQRIDVEFLELLPPVRDLSTRERFEAFRQTASFLATVRFHYCDDDVDAFGLPLQAMRQHLKGFAHTGRGADKYLELSTPAVAESGQQRLG